MQYYLDHWNQDSNFLFLKISLPILHVFRIFFLQSSNSLFYLYSHYYCHDCLLCYVTELILSLLHCRYFQNQKSSFLSWSYYATSQSSLWSYSIIFQIPLTFTNIRSIVIPYWHFNLHLHLTSKKLIFIFRRSLFFLSDL
jgi:hypothetical protein